MSFGFGGGYIDELLSILNERDKKQIYMIMLDDHKVDGTWYVYDIDE